MADPQRNFVKELTREEFKLFRKRVVGMILATDMAKHAGDLAAMKEVISQDEVKADRKQLALPAYRVEDEAEKFQKQ